MNTRALPYLTRTQLAAVLLGLAALSAPTLGDVVDEDFKLLASDGATDNQFGFSVAIDNGVIAVGARGDDDTGASSGSAYLYDAATGVQVAKLVPSDGAASNEFGFSIAIDGGIVAVGARGDDDNGASSGSAYLFDASTGAQLAKLVPSDGQPGDEFGFTIAISGGIVVVGARFDDDNGDNSGSAYLFDASTGVQLEKLLADDGDANDRFGGAVAVDNGVVAIGARWHGEGFFRPGAAYLFDASTGNQLHKLVADDGANNDFFGDAIAIDNGIVAVGAWAKSIFFDHSGAAYLFDAATGAQIGSSLVPSDGHDRDHFGISIDIDNNVVAIGAHQDGDNGFSSGSAYLWDASTGSQITKLLASDGEVFDLFGTSVATDNGMVVVGAIGDEDNGPDSGSAYVFGGACPADFNDDGDVNTLDVLAFLNAWSAGDPAADFNGDGTVNTLDVLAFLNAWSAGC